MPYPNYHAARVRDPGAFSRIVTLKTFPNGVMLLGGPLKGSPGGGSTAQAYRFPKSRFTAAQARKWLKDHNIKTIGFEAASGGSSEAVEGVWLQEGCFEGVTFEETEQNNIVHNVVLLGPQSRNKRRYSEQAMRNAAPLYENRKCFINHTTHAEAQAGRRDVERIAGKYVNARFDESDQKLKADAVLLKDDPAGRKFWNIARQMPDVAGLSHNATGRMKRVNGEDIVEEITKVISVDLVAEPATTAGMYEDHNPNERANEMEWPDITLHDLKNNRHDIYEAIVEEGKQSRDDEVKELTDAKEKIEGELDTLKVKEATREKEAVVAEAIKDLPEHARTDVFRRMCMNAAPPEGKTFTEAVEELVADRKAATEPTGVRNMGGDKRVEKPTKEDIETRGQKVDAVLQL